MNASTPPAAPGTAPVGRWVLTAVPPGWGFVPGYGLRSLASGTQPSSLLLTEDVLPGGEALSPYTHSQSRLLAQTFPQSQILGPAAGEINEADEAEILILKHEASGGGAIFQIQTYARRARWIGIVTLTASAQDLGPARMAMKEILAGLRILPEADAASTA